MLPVNISLENRTILVTGAAGFIGAALVSALLRTAAADAGSTTVIGMDNLNDYYAVSLKEHRLSEIEKIARAHPSVRWIFARGSVADAAFLTSLFDAYHPSVVIHLAAQAGVRYSISHPEVYMESNIWGFYHILEACRHHAVAHLVYASSSSVYGAGEVLPYATEARTDSPVSLYAATKKSNEVMAHAYAALYGIPMTGLRFFTVYGPAGRPDMAYFSFTDRLRSGGCIDLFNHGACRRDFTYVDDIVEGILRVMRHAPTPLRDASGSMCPPYALYNIGASHPENLLDFVTILCEELIRAGILPTDYDLSAHLRCLPMQPGDVPATYADTEPLERDFGYQPSTPLREGLRRFAEWYREYFGLR